MKRFPIGLVAASASVALWLACGDGNPPTNTPTMTLSANRYTLANDGTQASISVTTATGGAAGTGDVTFTVDRGSFSNGQQSVTATLNAGVASVDYSCDAVVDTECLGGGRARFVATWGTVSSVLDITITVVGGGGTDAGDAGGGNPDAGDGGGGTPDAGDAGAFIPDGGVFAWNLSKTRVFLEVGDYSDVVLTLKSKAGDAGLALRDVPVSVGSNLGQFLASDGGLYGPSFIENTGTAGELAFRFTDEGDAGFATLTAETPWAVQGSVAVELVRVQSVTHVSTTCDTVTNCTQMGTKNSGYREQSQVKFKVVDAANRAVPGVVVAFLLSSGAPAGVTVSPSALTNAQGEVTTNVSAGTGNGSFSVRAIVISGRVEVSSTAISVIRAKPTNRNFVLSCNPLVAPALVTSPPRSTAITCSTLLVDRLNTAVPTRPNVNFGTEAGVLASSSVQAAANGTVSVTFNTTAAADDVAPLPEDLGQVPDRRAAEPSAGSFVVSNPRDGLVTVYAFVKGEEYFEDGNNDGVRNDGEQFYDMAEPFIDDNDNGVLDQGEEWIADSNNNGAWDGPNGVWDANTDVWTETRVLLVGNPDPDQASLAPAAFAGACGTGELFNNEGAYLTPYFPDFNLNRLPVGTALTINKVSGGKGTVRVDGPASLGDGYGFKLERRLVDVANNSLCTSSSPRCTYKLHFSNWGRGAMTTRGLVLAPTTGTGCETAVVSMTATLPSTLGAASVTKQASGGVGTQVLADGGVPDAGPGAILITAAPSRLFVDIPDHSNVVATLKSAPDGGGAPVAGEQVTLTTSLGEFTDNTGTSLGTSFAAATDINGQVSVRLVDLGVPGTADVGGSTARGATGSASVAFRKIQSISHVSTTCGGANCILLGAMGSGYNEQALIKFVVKDAAGDPVPGLAVTFEGVNAPTGTTVSSTGTTNAAGEVTTFVTSGTVTGAFSVKAIAVAGVEVTSPALGVTGARPVNTGFTFSCRQVNIPAYISNNPPLEVTVKCDLRVTDRYNNPVGTGPSVNFKAEAGVLPAAAQFTVYKPTQPTGDDGTLVVDYVTGGVIFPEDVTPQDGAGNLFEPRRLDASRTRNPRDGLVSLIAYLTGEEGFDDANANGSWDTDERFYDQGEPLVDHNDNGVRDPGEFWVDVIPNGRWDGPNGVRDSNTTIWTETRVLWTNVPLPELAKVEPAAVAGPCGSGELGNGSSRQQGIYFPDFNYNRPMFGATLAVTRVGTKGTMSLLPGSTVADRYGFTGPQERQLYDVDTDGACVPSSKICRWRYVFSDFSAGYTGIVLSTVAPTSGEGCENVTATVNITTLGNTVGLVTTGGIGTPKP